MDKVSDITARLSDHIVSFSDITTTLSDSRDTAIAVLQCQTVMGPHRQAETGKTVCNQLYTSTRKYQTAWTRCQTSPPDCQTAWTSYQS